MEKHKHYEKERLSLETYLGELGKDVNEVIQEFGLQEKWECLKQNSTEKINARHNPMLRITAWHTIRIIPLFGKLIVSPNNPIRSHLYQQRLDGWNKHVIVEGNNIHMFLAHFLCKHNITLVKRLKQKKIRVRRTQLTPLWPPTKTLLKTWGLLCGCFL